MFIKNKRYKTVIGILLVFVMMLGVCLTGCGEERVEIKSKPHHEENVSDHNNSSIKINITEEDREASAEEQKIIDKLYISNIDRYGIEYGDNIYSTVTLTGAAMPEETIYSVKDIEELIRISFKSNAMNDVELYKAIDGYYGLDFIKFAELCGIDKDMERLCIICEDEQGNRKSFSYDELTEKNIDALLSVGSAEGPFGISSSNGKDDGMPIKLLVFEKDELKEQADASRIIAGKGKRAKDPAYHFHDQSLYEGSLPIEFTVEVYREGAEYQGAVDTAVFTTEDIENFMREEPSKVCRSYYGTIGSLETYNYAGVGGWVDYFEGIDFLWLLQEKVGITSLEGRAELIDRDGNVYNTIDDISYFDHEGREEDYYIMTGDGVKISGDIPMIACAKNGYPILKEHDHESAAYVAYSTLNDNLLEKGVSTEVGVIKNHNGPFAACFGNLDGYYGGEQVETAGDCVSIRLYLK